MAHTDKSRCRFCGSRLYGTNCNYSNLPRRVHEHGPTGGDYDTCVFCGLHSARNGIAYGKGCKYSPDGTHKHFSDGIHCIWCGLELIDPKTGKQKPGASGRGCKYSPNGYHSL